MAKARKSTAKRSVKKTKRSAGAKVKTRSKARSKSRTRTIANPKVKTVTKPKLKRRPARAKEGPMEGAFHAVVDTIRETVGLRNRMGARNKHED